MDVTHVRVDPSVTVIPEGTFERRQQLEVVELPEGLIQIESNAFRDCKSLQIINIPSTVTEIGPEAFICRKLDGIVLPDGLQTLGSWAFHGCQSLQRIIIPPRMKTIEQAVFLCCESLTDVVLSEDLEEIKQDAFSFCNSLSSITLPSSLKVIGRGAFEWCTILNEVHMHDSVEAIGSNAFKNCSIIHFRTPPQMIELNFGVFGGNACLVSLELSDTDDTYRIEHSGLRVQGTALRNITIPLKCAIDTSLLEKWDDLGVAFPGKDGDAILDALKHRFDGLPIHKICYYQSYHDSETTMQHLNREINPRTTKPPGLLSVSSKQQDCLGMTPLHILACSSNPTVEMYRLLIEKYPETLIMKDKWGDIPLLYAFWCGAPVEVLDLLVGIYKSLHPEYEFDWKGMVETLANRNAPLTSIRKLVNAQNRSFPHQDYDIQQVVLELALSDANRGCGHKRPISIETFRYLLRVSIARRLDSLAVSKWRVDMENSISNLDHFRKASAIHDRLAAYESIEEGTSVLELAIWKAKIDSSRNKRSKVDGDASYKEQCRINSGADIVIRNVLPYLLPKGKV